MSTDLDLERLLAAERPVPRAAWAEDLDARAAAGFARPAAPRSARRRRRLPSVSLVPALGAAASVVLVVVVVSALTSGSSPTSRPTAVAPALEQAAPEAASRDAAKSAGGVSAGGVSAGPSIPARREVVRSTQLTLGVRPGRMQPTAQRVYAVVGAFGGIVDSSTVSSGGPGASATFSLRIPSSRVGPAVARLAALGKVRSQTGTTNDVTGSFVSARERLGAALAERRALLRALTKATTTTAIDALKQRIRLAEGRISAARGDLRRIRARVSYSRVSVQLVSTGPAPVHHGGGGGGYTPGKALGDAGRILRVAAAVAIVTLLVAIPLALLAAAGAFAGRRARRRRREAALGPA